jgi:NTE family protein
VWLDHRCLLVSDAGPRYKPDPHLGPIWKALRVAVTLMEQGTEVRKRWLISRFLSGDLEGTYWSLDSVLGDYADDGAATPVYSDALVRDLLSQVRVDLDVFSDGEIAALENHGYAMATVALERHAPELARAGAPAPELPHPEWADEEKAAAALEGSSRTKMFARGFQSRVAAWRLARR